MQRAWPLVGELHRPLSAAPSLNPDSPRQDPVSSVRNASKHLAELLFLSTAPFFIKQSAFATDRWCFAATHALKAASSAKLLAPPSLDDFL
jgi:hypothetical protein